MKTFKDFLESEVPSITTPVMGKPDGGMVKKSKEPPVEKREELEEDESGFTEIFSGASKELRDILKHQK